MTASKTLSSLKASQLKHIASATGLVTTGTKSELEGLLRKRLDQQWLCTRSPVITSVDMGIKNLGVCVIEAPHLLLPAETRQLAKDDTPPVLKVLRWQKIDVLSQLASRAQAMEIDTATRRENTRTSIDPTVFRPSILSRTAVDIARAIQQTYQPSHILIERQRFRSGGASAVQEWTLRVNMLESMLWASLETMRRSPARDQEAPFPEVLEVSPARVAKFWCSKPMGTSTHVKASMLDSIATSREPTEKGASKIDKKDKINVVRSWLAAKGTHPDVRLELSNEAQQTASAFETGLERGRRRRNDSLPAPESAGAKLDDLADCLLQGVAWVRWEENRRRLAQLLDFRN